MRARGSMCAGRLTQQVVKSRFEHKGVVKLIDLEAYCFVEQKVKDEHRVKENIKGLCLNSKQ